MCEGLLRARLNLGNLMKDLWCAPLFLLPAQEPVITAETPVEQGTRHQWLHNQAPA
jgi:hypothetical protein